MRTYIFTGDEVRRLRNWLETGEEDQTTRILFSRMRKNLPHLRADLELLLEVTKKLREEGRLRKRMRLPRDLDSTLRSAGSRLTLIRKGRNTSAA